MVQKNGHRSRALHEHTPPAKTIIAALKLRMVYVTQENEAS